MDRSIIARQALVLNNNGITLATHGNDKAAILNFTQALAAVRSVMTSVNGEEGEINGVHTGQNFVIVAEPSDTLSNLEDPTCFVYNRSIRISPSNRDTSEESFHIYSAIIIFNMALLYHRQGLRLGRVKSLELAGRLYSMIGKKLLVHESILGTEAIALTVKVAAMNNFSQLHYRLGELEATISGFRDVADVLSNFGHKILEVFSDFEYEEIYLNTLVVMSLPIAPAA